MIIHIADNPKADYPRRLLAWILERYHPMSMIEGLEPKSLNDDLSTIVFSMGTKFYGPIRQTLMPKDLWVPLSRFMVASKNARKDITETDLRRSSDYQSRCVLIDPQGVMGFKGSSGPYMTERQEARKDYERVS